MPISPSSSSVAESTGPVPELEVFVITRSKQSWQIGHTVRVGFLTLRVIGVQPTPGDYRPDAYLLESFDGLKQYRFVPHNGLERVQ